jgi:hypothetical protein
MLTEEKMLQENIFKRMRLDKGNRLDKGKSIINNASTSLFVNASNAANGGNGTDDIIYSEEGT